MKSYTSEVNNKNELIKFTQANGVNVLNGTSKLNDETVVWEYTVNEKFKALDYSIVKVNRNLEIDKVTQTSTIESIEKFIVNEYKSTRLISRLMGDEYNFQNLTEGIEDSIIKTLENEMEIEFNFDEDLSNVNKNNQDLSNEDFKKRPKTNGEKLFCLNINDIGTALGGVKDAIEIIEVLAPIAIRVLKTKKSNNENKNLVVEQDELKISIPKELPLESKKILIREILKQINKNKNKHS